MRRSLRPLRQLLVEAGPADPVFNGLLLAGPVVITLITVLGRTTLTVAVVALYLLVFLGYILVKGRSYEGGS